MRSPRGSPARALLAVAGYIASAAVGVVVHWLTSLVLLSFIAAGLTLVGAVVFDLALEERRRQQ
jgi:Flp pilus assembly protein TadB